MDISEASERRFEIGLDQFLAGHAVAYHRVVFSVSKKQELEICSYSDFQPENTTEEMMWDKINRAEEILTDLQTRSARFREAIKGMSKRHLFCHDYGTAAVAIAVVQNGAITWRDQRIRVANQAAEPTRTVVTPPAGAGDRAAGARGSP
jgi:hypothetical protein